MDEVVIVAIPEEDDPVWKVSSEKVPHLTICYLQGPLANEENTIRYVEHAVKTSLHRFGLSVDRRGLLGSDDADVLFFDKSYGLKELLAFRGFLLANKDILEAYRKAPQYDVWTPHLTLGYPASPAKPLPEDRRIHWVGFDRIAVWTSDFDGPEFVLKQNEDFALDAAWSFKDSYEYFAHKFKESDVKRDAKGRFSNKASSEVALDPDVFFKEFGFYPKGVASRSYTNYGHFSIVTTNLRYEGNKDTISIFDRYDSNNKLESRKIWTTDPDTPEKTFKTFGSKDKDHLNSLDWRLSKKHSVEKLVKDVSKGNFKKAGKRVKDTAEGGLFDFFTKNKPPKLKHSEESVDDVLMHFGVKGMRWGVRRSIGPDGLVLGRPPGLSKKNGSSSGSQPKLTKGKKGQSQGSADHQRMVKNLNKNVEDLSTNDIRELTNRIRAVNEFKATTASEKAAKASAGRKLTGWALNQVKKGAKRSAESWIQEATGDVVKNVLPKTATQKLKDAKEEAKRQKEEAKKNKDNSSQITREQAVSELATEIRKMPKGG